MNHQPSTLDRERAVLVKLILRDMAAPFVPVPDEETLDELAALADTAGAQIVARLVQRRSGIDPAYFIGKGKAEALAEACRVEEADLVIVDHDLAPAQARNLEKVTERRVVDRTQLILDIFARRARTHTAKLQVELAQLQYELPRLRRMWTHLSRIEGGIGLRGPGETQLEVDRRRARKRIADLQKELTLIARRKTKETAGRGEFFTIALVGYTNVGKTALMNLLTGAELFTENRLFATLDATTRKLKMPHGQRVLLTDTVGFISDIPHHLVASFHATLEEVREADLLLHVADAGHPEVAAQIQSVRAVLRTLGCEESPTLLVLNKLDLPGAAARLTDIRRDFGEVVAVSALRRHGLTDLLNAIERKLHEQQVKLDLSIPAADGQALAYLFNRGTVLSRQQEDSIIHVSAIIGKREAAQLQRYVRHGG